MDATIIRQKIHRFIDRIEDRKIKAIYILFEKDIEGREEADYTPQFKAELDRRYEAYKQDSKVITREAMDKRIKNAMKPNS